MRSKAPAAPTPVVVALVPAALAAVLAVAGCPAPGGGDCAAPADCAQPDDAPCGRCAPLATSLCLAGACEDRAADAVDVSATFSIDRHISPEPQGLAFAVAARDRSCADLGSFAAFPANLNALASGQKTLSGGTFHPDVALGRVPEGDVLVLALATSGPAGGGDVVAHGCAEATAAQPSLAVPAMDLAP